MDEENIEKFITIPYTFKSSNCLYSLHHNNYAVKIVLVM